MTTLSLDQVSCELVALPAPGTEMHLGAVTDALTWSEQTGDLTVTVNASLQNVDDVGDGRDLWAALGGDGGRYRIDASWDGQTIVSVWEGSAWVCRLRGTGRDSIELVCYDDLRATLTDEVYYVGPNGPNGETANAWLERVLTDGGPAIGDVSKPNTRIRQYLFQGQPRGQIIDQVLRWAFFRTPATVDGQPNPEKVPYLLQMRFGPNGWAAYTIRAGSNTTYYAFDESNCAEFGDEQSIEQLVRSVSIYSPSALIQGGAPGLSPYAPALSADYVAQTATDGQGRQITQVVPRYPSYQAPSNLGPLRRVLGGGGADNPQMLTEMAQDTLAIFGQPWKVRTLVVPLMPFIRRGDVHFFNLKTLHDWYIITGVIHNWAARQTTLTIDSSGVLGRRIVAQQTLGIQGGDASTGDTAGATQPVSSDLVTAVTSAATNPFVLGKPYVFGGPEGRTAMDQPAAFTSSDCSGFVAWAYYIGSGGTVDLRDGVSVSTVSLYAKTSALAAAAAQPGDLVFYGMDQGDLAHQHVALYLGPDQVVSETAPGLGVMRTTVAGVALGRTTEYRRLNR